MAYNSMSIYPNPMTTDIFVSNGQISRAFGSDSIRENVKQRLMTVYQEWFLDLRLGLPWYTELTGKVVSLEKIKSSVARTILGTQYVVELINLRIDYDNNFRRLSIWFEYRDEYNNIVRESL